MSSNGIWTIADIIIIIGAVLAPISAFVFLAGGIFNFTNTIKKLTEDYAYRKEQNMYRDSLLTYLLTREANNRYPASPAGMNSAQYVEYTAQPVINRNNEIYYQPLSLPLPLGNKQGKKKGRIKGFLSFMGGFFTAVLLLFVLILLS